nr:hypothetical protein Iba_chr12dCG3960 [Ipomoea batatas]
MAGIATFTEKAGSEEERVNDQVNDEVDEEEPEAVSREGEDSETEDQAGEEDNDEEEENECRGMVECGRSEVFRVV